MPMTATRGEERPMSADSPELDLDLAVDEGVAAALDVDELTEAIRLVLRETRRWACSRPS